MKNLMIFVVHQMLWKFSQNGELVVYINIVGIIVLMFHYMAVSTYVKYYRYSLNHNHSFTFQDYNEKYHYEKCDCGTLIKKHHFVLNKRNPKSILRYIPEYKCDDCRFITLFVD